MKLYPLAVLCALGGAALFAGAAGCDIKDDPSSETDLEDDDAMLCEIPQAVTYTEDAKQIFDRSCISCHSSERTGVQRNGAPVVANFDNYEDAADSSAEANARIQDGIMPPSGPLGACDRKIVQKWVDGDVLE